MQPHPTDHAKLAFLRNIVWFNAYWDPSGANVASDIEFMRRLRYPPVPEVPWAAPLIRLQVRRFVRVLAAQEPWRGCDKVYYMPTEDEIMLYIV